MRGGVLALAGALALGLAGCVGAAPRTPGDPLRVVAGFYPLQFVAEQVGGARVQVTNLAAPGVEPHDLELSPRQAAEIADADVVLYIAGFQPAVDEAVSQDAVAAGLDVSTAVPLLPAVEGGAKDPHIWLDPMRLGTVADAMAARFAAIDAGGADQYRQGAAALRTRLGALDEAYRNGLKACARRDIVVSHAAFGYLAQRFRLNQIAVTGLSPEVEPTPQRLADVAATAKQHQVTTIFFETLASPKVAQAIATEVGASTAVLDPIEGLEPGSSEDYFSVMRANLSTLRPALGCS